MSPNPQPIIQDIRQEFEMLIEFVTGDQAEKATADHVERSLFKMLLALGAKLLTLFFVMRSENCTREAIQNADGQRLPYHKQAKRVYFSIFGKVPIVRPYFYQKGVGGQSLLDAELGLGADSYSDLVREIADYLGVYTVYHKSADILQRLLGLNLSSRVIEAGIAADAGDVTAFYEQKQPFSPATEAEILVVQADGKGVPLVYDEPASAQPVRLGKGQKRGRKKEAIVTGVYTIAPQSRTPQQVVDSFFRHQRPHAEEKITRPKPQNKQLWATLDGKDTALNRLHSQVAEREGCHIQQRVALCDGCEALQKRLIARFPDFTLILDFIHADEYLWDAANALLGENNPERIEWMADYTLKILSDQTEQVIATFEQMAQDKQYSAKQRTQLKKTAAYFQRNLPYMAYATYLERGWPIASGVIEGACRHFVKDRCELSGMRWTRTGAENLLLLRAVAENDDWDDYHRFRQRQRHWRLYQTPYPEQVSPEFEALAPIPASKKERPTPDVCQVEPSVPNSTSEHYYKLPLAV